MLSKTDRVILFEVYFAAIRTITGTFSLLYPAINGITVYEIGLIKSFQFFIILTLNTPVSYFADKRGYTLSLKSSVVFGILSFTILGFSYNLQLFLVSEFFNALSLLLFGGAYQTLLFETFKDSEKQYKYHNGKYTKYSHLAMFITAIIGSLILEALQIYIIDWKKYVYIFFLITASALYILYLYSDKILFTDIRISSVPHDSFSFKHIKEDIISTVLNLKKTTIIFLVSSYILFLIVFNLLVHVWQPLLIKLFSDNIPALYLSVFISLVMYDIAIFCWILTHTFREQKNNITFIFISSL